MAKEAVSLASFWARWKEICGVDSSAYDVAWGTRSVEAFLSYHADARPLNGCAVLFSSHLLLCEAVGARVVFSVALLSVRGMRCSGQLELSRNSFDDENSGRGAVARRSVSLDIFLDGAAVTLRMMGVEGEQFARVALLLWRMSHGEAKMEAVAVGTPLHHPGDAVYALAGAPVRLSATVVQCVTGESCRMLDAGEAVEIAMLNEREVCIARRPRTAATFWRDFYGSHSEELQILPVEGLSALVAPFSTTVRLVGCRGETWMFAIADPATNFTVRHALQRFIELFLLGMMRGWRGGAVDAVEACHRLRYFDLAALYQQYCAMDAEGAGYLLCSSLEAAMGPLLACDSRLVRAMCCHDGDGDDGKVSLPMYLNHMRVLLHGSVAERTRVAFRAFGGDMCGGATAGLHEMHGAAHEKGKPEQSGLVRLMDFKLILRDILAGLAYTPANAEESVDDAVNRILASVHGGGGEGEGDTATVSFQAFLPAYTLLVGLLGAGETWGCDVAPVCGTPHPLLGIGSAHWVLLTYIMTGVEISVRAAVAAEDCGNKNTFVLTVGSSTIAEVASVQGVGALPVAPNFFQKRFAPLQGGRATFTDFSPLLFASVRRRFGITVEKLLSALGINALRARLLLGYFCVPRVLRSSSRSGALLLSSHDHRFILKRVTHAESRTLRGQLPAYVDHLDRHAHTLLPRYAGLYALWRGGEKTIVVISENVFAFAQLPVAEVYDLKGSTMHRTTAAEDRRHGAAGKDNDFLADKKQLHLSAEAQRALLAQLEADTELLNKANILDYSLLVGIYSGEAGWSSTPEAVELAQRQRQRMEKLAAALGAPPAQPLESDPDASKQGDDVFHAYYGGIASADGTEVYFLGMVDCLTTYSIKKVGEHFSKSVLLQDMKKISCVPPSVYRSRFLNFMRTVIDG
ncbi:putative phosphatidylinositol-4-phosphate 5-kinase [Trypanosoma rangeli]|uniref:Putative phosphatidylinositol-4-phosphate 5-kinase n=1 Tax=Trypanosoma rangeli TaxID=5698 RepID=A0A3S5IQZ5_TRYRA|nr:putative phosphatidylinositol-4-phosphate 5-kinase [Trypanosoma rangeli]RNF03373.1 putative phosphatidylinositol-4-phosphate 5-kinase [Trypanosoma rangeli]|eukprot:RNF03373.1 putative phosphatidylinositol-4-phosphate 5-kinase [Trypanosoma rangeli]